MVTLWFLFLLIFSQAYILLAMQAIEYGKRIHIFQKQTQQQNQFAYSFFLHLAQIIAQNDEAMGDEEKTITIKQKGVEGCYATVKKKEKQEYSITITINQKNIEKRYHGIVLVEENSFSVFPLEHIDNNASLT